MFLALLNASALIEIHSEAGLRPKDVNETTEEGLEEYAKACRKASDLIVEMASKYKTR